MRKRAIKAIFLLKLVLTTLFSFVLIQNLKRVNIIILEIVANLDAWGKVLI